MEEWEAKTLMEAIERLISANVGMATQPSYPITALYTAQDCLIKQLEKLELK